MCDKDEGRLLCHPDANMSLPLSKLLCQFVSRSLIGSGYNLPFGPEKFIPFFGGPEFHDYHHHFYTGNFASTFSYMDYIYGTDVHYKQWKAKQEGVKEKST